MLELIAHVRSAIAVTIALLCLGLQLWALVDAGLRPADAYRYAEKQSKTFWCVLLAVGLSLSLLFLMAPTSLFGLIAVTAAGVYLADVRPALQSAPRPGRQSRPGRPGGPGRPGPW